MSVRKKNLCVRNIKVYPVDFDMSKRCFVRFYTEGGRKIRIIIPKGFNTIELRQKEAKRIVSSLEDNGYTEKEKNEIPSTANEHCLLIFNLIEVLKNITTKTRAAYACHARAVADAPFLFLSD